MFIFEFISDEGNVVQPVAQATIQRRYSALIRLMQHTHVGFDTSFTHDDTVIPYVDSTLTYLPEQPGQEGNHD